MANKKDDKSSRAPEPNKGKGGKAPEPPAKAAAKPVEAPKAAEKPAEKAPEAPKPPAPVTVPAPAAGGQKVTRFPLTVDFAFLSDYGEVANKIYAQGIGIDAVLARSTPVRHPQLFMVAQMRAPRNVGEQDLELSFVDPKGKVLLRNVGKLRFTPPAFGDLGVARFAMGFYSLEFPTFGGYTIRLAVAGTEVIRLPLHLIPVGRQAATPQPAGV